MYCTIPLKNRKCIIQSINCTLQQQQGFGGSFRYCTSSLYHLNLSPFYQTPLQAVCRYKVTYGVIKCMFSASIELALLRGLDKFSQLSKGSFNPSGVLLTQFAWIAPAWGTGSDRTKFHWHDKISYQVLSTQTPPPHQRCTLGSRIQGGCTYGPNMKIIEFGHKRLSSMILGNPVSIKKLLNFFV